MRWLYRMLLALYPPEHRIEFGDEMLAVFSRLAAEKRTEGVTNYARFVIRELAGLIAGASCERAHRVSFWPALAGIALAAALHSVFYTAASRVLHRVGVAMCNVTLPSGDPRAAGLTVGLYGVITLLCLLPMLFLLSMRLTARRR